MLLTCSGRFAWNVIHKIDWIKTQIMPARCCGDEVRVKLTVPINLSLAKVVLHSDSLWLMVASGYCIFLLLRDKVSACEVHAVIEEFRPVGHEEFLKVLLQLFILPHESVLLLLWRKTASISTHLVHQSPPPWVMPGCYWSTRVPSLLDTCNHKLLNPAHPVWPDNHPDFIPLW